MSRYTKLLSARWTSTVTLWVNPWGDVVSYVWGCDRVDVVSVTYIYLSFTNILYFGPLWPKVGLSIDLGILYSTIYSTRWAGIGRPANLLYSTRYLRLLPAILTTLWLSQKLNTSHLSHNVMFLKRRHNSFGNKYLSRATSTFRGRKVNKTSP